MNEYIKIMIDKTDVLYCFQANSYEEFEKRFNNLKFLLSQRFQNEMLRKVCKYERIFLMKEIYGKKVIK